MEESLLQEKKRAHFYKFLSECYHVPDKNLLNWLNSLDRSKKGIYSEVAEYIPDITELESLVVDYSSLFLGPFQLLAPPYGSLYLEDNNETMGRSTIDAKNWYKQEGLDITLKEVPDHVAIELEFVYFLICKEIEAIENRDYEKACNYLKKEVSFLEEHLGKWVSEFSLRVEKNAQTDFYKRLARFTDSFVKEDLILIKRR